MSTEHHDHDINFDTSKMSAGQREALEITEAAREKEWTYKSFGSQLFMGIFDRDLIFPFPTQSLEEKKIGDEYIKKLKTYLEQNLDPEEVDRTRTIPQKIIDDFFTLGVFAMKVPKEYGGLGFSQVNYNRVMMMLASYCGGTAVMVSAHQSIGVPQPLKLFGTEAQKKKYFPWFTKDTISAFALTEPLVGSDPANMTTEAIPTEDGKSFIINGKKLWCTNGPIAKLLVVMAKTPPKYTNGKEKKQITAFIVERDTPGIKMEHRCEFMGLGGMQNALMSFTNVKVPRENILYGEGRGLKLALTTLNAGRMTLPAASVGLAKQCLSIARRFGKSRVQWGQPIGLHEEGRKKISYIASRTFAMEAMTMISSYFVDKGDVDIRMESAMTKLFASETAWKIIDQTMQLCGGRGYEKASSLKARGEHPYPVERMMRDARINTIIEGTSEILKLFLAREALDPHLKVAGDLLDKRSSLSKKCKALLRMLGFYIRWYPMLWWKTIQSFFSLSHGNFLSCHLRFIERKTQKLARSLFHSMMLYQARLEKKQVRLGHLIEVAVELFAMTASISYAHMLSKKNPADTSPRELADLFCRETRLSINDHFRALCCNSTKKANKIAKSILDGEMKWMEDGIIWIGDKE